MTDQERADRLTARYQAASQGKDPADVKLALEIGRYSALLHQIATLSAYVTLGPEAAAEDRDRYDQHIANIETRLDTRALEIAVAELEDQEGPR